MIRNIEENWKEIGNDGKKKELRDKKQWK